ncbi:hypothetical protein V6N13_002055 [Hibiscus sabdariffa]
MSTSYPYFEEDLYLPRGEENLSLLEIPTSARSVEFISFFYKAAQEYACDEVFQDGQWFHLVMVPPPPKEPGKGLVGLFSMVGGGTGRVYIWKCSHQNSLKQLVSSAGQLQSFGTSISLDLLSILDNAKCANIQQPSTHTPLPSKTGSCSKQTRKMGQIQYSEKYFDDTYEYRHVVLPSEVAKLLPKNRLLSENEWRAIGVQQSRGWVHYAIHRPEPHIMLFRRPLNYQQPQENQTQQSMLAK